MANYILKKLSPSTWNIHLRRRKVGFVRECRDGTFLARIDNVVKRDHATAKGAFHEVVAACNRISLCGEDDHDKAAAALEERNRKVAAERDELNAQFSNLGTRYRIRNRRISI